MAESINKLAEAQSLLDRENDLFLPTGYRLEHSLLSVVSLDKAGPFNRTQVFRIAIQEYIKHALHAHSYANLADLRANCNASCFPYQQSITYLLENACGRLIDVAQDLVDAVTDEFITAGSEDKLVRGRLDVVCRF